MQPLPPKIFKKKKNRHNQKYKDTSDIDSNRLGCDDVNFLSSLVRVFYRKFDSHTTNDSIRKRENEYETVSFSKQTLFSYFAVAFP